ncbi:hypothetical protein O7608_02360 [Solwaraspora sp. WMMA2056]|uniref:hypothetical protein n=1 Tax=Solwaraspora sp. WMMA2056 TaxID=3015161 RepID=UPI00259B7612|nr:hypothetical protein [Solwaraspora sp. WMMA2056]WJK41304.1 hypothetical protein O7608_02360 [Solwaraspora sp. WMMA2056]
MVDERPSFAAGDGDDESVEEAAVDPGVPETVMLEAINTERIRSIVGLIIGGGVMVGGIVVLILGLSAAVDWTIEGFGISSQIQTSGVGLVVSIIGLLAIALTRPMPPTRRRNRRPPAVVGPHLLAVRGVLATSGG